MTPSEDPYATEGPDSQRTTPPVGRVPVDDDVNVPGYDILDELGRGGMGVVYHARQHSTGDILALKMILCGRDATLHELARFRVEAEAMACLNHPNIIQIRDIGLAAGFPYIALEFAKRGTLKQLINRQPQDPVRAAETVKTLSFAMQHAHSRAMLHRDLKPANILIMGDGTLKISDFGLVKFSVPFGRMGSACRIGGDFEHEFSRFAREFQALYPAVDDSHPLPKEEVVQSSWQACAERTGLLNLSAPTPSLHDFLTASITWHQTIPSLDHLTRTGSVMGSAHYMAPEQAAGDLRRIGRHTDIYALGVILYEMLTGQPPFQAPHLDLLLSQVRSNAPPPPRRNNPTIPAELERLCLKCLEKEPEQRYSTAFELGEALHYCLAGLTRGS